MIEIELTRGMWTQLDDVDMDLLRFNWYYLSSGGYAARNTGKGLVRLHRVVLERMLQRSLTNDEYPDHVDNNGLNNRRSNLRLATKSQNAMNTNLRSDNKSGFKGVSYVTSRDKYKAAIMCNGKTKHLGYFDTPEEAHEAYKQAAIDYHGEFAKWD